MSFFKWSCKICGKKHEDLPTCFGADAPWAAIVPEREFKDRVVLTQDQCIVDQNVFFIRGHIEIPVLGMSDPFAFSVWTSLSEKSFLHMSERWNDSDRVMDPPYFGWLSSPVPPYVIESHLPLSVQVREPGLVPLFTVKDEGHALAIDQHQGITIRRWHEIALDLLGK